MADRAAALRAHRSPRARDAPADPWSYRDRVHVDTITHDPEVLGLPAGRLGADRLVLGTDLPFDMATPDPLGELDVAGGADLVRAAAEGNPEGLYAR